VKFVIVPVPNWALHHSAVPQTGALGPHGLTLSAKFAANGALHAPAGLPRGVNPHYTFEKKARWSIETGWTRLEKEKYLENNVHLFRSYVLRVLLKCDEVFSS